MDVVDEAAPALDLDDRNPLAVLGFERGIAVDRDFAEVEAELLVRRADHTLRRLAEVAAGRGVEDDFGYG